MDETFASPVTLFTEAGIEVAQVVSRTAEEGVRRLYSEKLYNQADTLLEELKRRYIQGYDR